MDFSDANIHAEFWTHGVQVAVTCTDGTPVTDAALVAQIIADLAGLPQCVDEVRVEPVGQSPDGVWLATVPAEVYVEACEEGGLITTHSSGYVFEIPMA